MSIPRHIFVLALASLCLVPAGAQAAGFTAAKSICGGAEGGERGSGQMDAAGRFYIACTTTDGANFDRHVRITAADGSTTRRVKLDLSGINLGNNATLSDVAPSPDGAYLYAIHYNSKVVYRFDRQGDRYVLNAGWKPAPFPGNRDVVGEFVATDANGDVYLSSGLWNQGKTGRNGLPTDHTIVKYRADGTYVTKFGTAADSWAHGVAFDSWGGLAVTANGSRVFVTDRLNGRIQRFDRNDATGAYAVARVFGNVQGDFTAEANKRTPRIDLCNTAGKLAAPYDVALSPGGEVVVPSTSCYDNGTIKVLRFTQDGALRGVENGYSFEGYLGHAIAVDRQGVIHLAQPGSVLLPPAGYAYTDAGGGPMGGNAAPAPDPAPPVGGGGPADPAPAPIAPAPVEKVAPQLAKTGVPYTTTSATITIVPVATDNVGITEVQFTEDGAAGPWLPWNAAGIAHTLNGTYGNHSIMVQVRDAAGNLSNRIIATVAWSAPKPGAVAKPPIAGAGGVAVATEFDTQRPVIIKATIPVQSAGRRIAVTVKSKDNVGVSAVRFASENGRWGKWQPLTGKRVALVGTGVGWKGMYVQVRDKAGNRSRLWFQPILVGPRGKMAWKKGSSRADHIVTGRGSHHIDSSIFDGKVDRISCGAGVDTVLAQREDIVAKDCERVIRLRLPVA
ncbi:MAG: S-layer y protein [Thermoleophilia bacterium]|nr:S-layer y protein [Thermoleophilia bacterium]